VNKKPTNVLVAHPGQQHSHHLAQALYEAEMLGVYIAGTPLLSNKNGVFPFLGRIKSTSIPSKFRRHPIQWHLLRYLGDVFPVNSFEFNYRVFHEFDRWLASKVDKLKPDLIIGYDNSCARTFEAAKSIGIPCILDAPSVHYQYAEKEVFLKKTGRYREAIKAQKIKEIELADAILCCSEFAASTYINAGVDSGKVCPVLLGSEPPLVMPSNKLEIVEKPRFIFAGVMSHRKAIDIILDVFSDLSGVAELIIVGGSESNVWIERCSEIENVNYFGKLQQSELYSYMKACDYLLLPSRFDAFGMVVVESLSVGTPVIVSSEVGAKEVIEMFPNSGEIVEPTYESLRECILKIIAEYPACEVKRKYALEAGAYFSWASYRKRVVSTILGRLGCV
jgi:glycosyltransferase involved in cell wall biosynthesis